MWCIYQTLQSGEYKNKFDYLFCIIWIYFQAYQVTSLFSKSHIHHIHMNKKTDSMYEFVLSRILIQVHSTFVENLVHNIVCRFLRVYPVYPCVKAEGSDKFITNLDLKIWLVVMLLCQVSTRIIRKLKPCLASVWHLVNSDVIIDIPSNINDYFIIAFSVCPWSTFHRIGLKSDWKLNCCPCLCLSCFG